MGKQTILAVSVLTVCLTVSSAAQASRRAHSRAAAASGRGGSPLGTWGLGNSCSYTFRGDGTVTRRAFGQGVDGTWKRLGSGRIEVFLPASDEGRWQADWEIRDGGRYLSLRHRLQIPAPFPTPGNDIQGLERIGAGASLVGTWAWPAARDGSARGQRSTLVFESNGHVTLRSVGVMSTDVHRGRWKRLAGRTIEYDPYNLPGITRLAEAIIYDGGRRLSLRNHRQIYAPSPVSGLELARQD